MYIRLCNRVESETILRKLFVRISKYYSTLFQNTNDRNRMKHQRRNNTTRLPLSIET